MPYIQACNIQVRKNSRRDLHCHIPGLREEWWSQNPGREAPAQSLSPSPSQPGDHVPRISRWDQIRMRPPGRTTCLASTRLRKGQLRHEHDLLRLPAPLAASGTVIRPCQITPKPTTSPRSAKNTHQQGHANGDFSREVDWLELPGIVTVVHVGLAKPGAQEGKGQGHTHITWR